MDKIDVIPVKFNGTNYVGWSFHLQHFVEGKGLVEFLHGTTTEPKDAEERHTWSQNNSKVVTWILNSIDPSISLSLHSYKKASEMWTHLKTLYHQTNKARKYYIDTELAKYSQGDKSVQQYYNGFLTLWNEKDSMILENVSSTAHAEVIKVQEESHISQFLMNLRPEFESVRAALMNRETSPHLDTCVQEVLREEIRLQSQHSLMEEPKAFIAPSAAPAFDEKALIAGKGQPLQCFDCKEYGHISRNCKKKKFCNYCKRNGHVISECTRRPPRRNEAPQHRPHLNPTALQTQVAPPADYAASQTIQLTQEQIQDMINTSVASAFTSMGVSGRYNSSSFAASISPSSWYIDSGASNHMTSVEQHFNETKPYTGTEQIIVANGNTLSISGIGSVDLRTPQNQSLTLSNVYFVPTLSANLLSVGQLVDSGYSIYFTSSGCVI